MLLSIVIVNYNVKYFLEQCLRSVEKAIAFDGGTEGCGFSGQVEVFVVDNSSSDGSLTWLQPKFPFVQFIANAENVGFARANNQALGQCRGKYILFLNPDTILPEDCFLQCSSFMEAHSDAGALGVRMIDGSGEYLPESKRGFPSPWVSFCKMSGLARLFPNSRWLARYYLGHLSSAGIHQVDVLSGAFLWARKEVLDKTGGFDERYFMYAEDIDLSYRIQQAGYRNYYLPMPTIIHFKGESTRRDSRYVKLFYTAMIQFVQKHYKGIGAWWYTKLLEGIIWVKSLGAGKNNPVEDDSGSSHSGSFDLVGDETGIVSMNSLLRGMSNGGNPGERDASALIFCEGNSFTYATIIKEWQTVANGKSLYIHGSNTHSAVGSDSTTAQGNVITSF